MTESDLKPLPADIQDLLRSASRPTAPLGFESHVLARIKATLDIPLGGGETPPTSGPTASDGGNTLGAATLTKMGTWGVPVSIVALVTGLGTGALVGRNLPRSDVPVAVIQQPPAAQPAVAESPLNPTPNEPTKAIEPAPVPRQKPQRRVRTGLWKEEPSSTGPDRDVALADERALIEMARTALAKRKTDKALEAIATHAQRFPDGQLVEERESLWVQALINAGKLDEARERAADFKRQFPESMLQPAIDAALNSVQ